MSRPHFTVLALALLFAAIASRTSSAPAIPKPPTPAETARWKQQGRTLPEPELLQPTLDPALSAFTPRHGPEMTGHLTGAASDVLALLTKQWITAFQKFYPHVVIDLPPPYAGSLGALELIKGDIDFVTVSRELRPSDVSAFRERFAYDPFSLPISGGTYRHFGFLDAIAFFVHRDNPLSQVNYTQLDAILSSTRLRGGAPITTWGQLGLTGEWADKPIHVWAVKPWNGFEEFIRQRVLSTGMQRGEWRNDLNFVETVFPVSPHVADDKYALGYAGLAYVGDGVKLLAVSSNDAAEFVTPDYTSVARGTYPLSRLVFLNANKPPGKPLSPVLDEFARFILSREGQQVILDEAIFLPLRAAAAERSRKSLD